MTRLVIMLGLAAGLAAPTGAQPVTTAPPPPADSQDKIVVTGKPKRICERGTETGSLMPKRVCRTQAEWDDQQRAAASLLERIRNNKVAPSTQANNR